MLLDVSSHLSTEALSRKLTPLFGGLPRIQTPHHLYVKETGFSITLKTKFEVDCAGIEPASVRRHSVPYKVGLEPTYSPFTTHYSFRLPSSGDFIRCRLNPRGKDPIFTT